jgi:type VI secretion system protein ImpH
LAIGGLGTPGSRERLSFDDGVLVPLAGRLGDIRRSAAGLETALRHVTGLPLRIAQAEATWMPLPPSEQSRLGTAFGTARLGGEDAAGLGFADAAVIGAAVLDVQHHFAVEIGPLDYDQLLDFCHEGAAIRMVSDVCRLAAGIEHRPVVRLAIRAGQVPPLRLAAPETPAYLGRTAWLGDLGPADRIVTDCAIPLSAELV